MIYTATKYHKNTIINLMKRFADESPINYCHQYSDMEYINKLLDEILAGKGKIFLADDYGIFMAIILPCIWSDKILIMHELAWYVTPEKRNGTTGYKLLKEYINYGDMLKRTKRIKGYTLSKLSTSPDLDYQRFGFHKQDETWIQ